MYAAFGVDLMHEANQLLNPRLRMEGGRWIVTLIHDDLRGPVAHRSKWTLAGSRGICGIFPLGWSDFCPRRYRWRLRRCFCFKESRQQCLFLFFRLETVLEARRDRDVLASEFLHGSPRFPSSAITLTPLQLDAHL